MSVYLRESPPRVMAQAWIPLNRAALCLTCETVFPLAVLRCPSCDGEACMPLGRWLKSVEDKRKEPTCTS